MSKKHIIALILGLICVRPLISCTCNPSPALSSEVINQYEYDAIFRGKVIAITEGGTASFSIDTLYMGQLGKQVTLSYDVETSCAMSFSPGQVWTIYGAWADFGVVSVTLCGHSRLQPTTDDYYISEFRPGYFEETKWLKDNLGTKEFSNPAEHDDRLHKNEMPGPGIAFGYLFAGLLGLAIIFYFVRRMFKRDGK